MKTPKRLLVVSSVLLGSVLLGIAQQALNRPAAPPVKPNADAPPVLALDRNTWNVFDPYNRGIDLSAANTPEGRFARWKAVLSFENSAEYERLFPRTREQKVASVAAALAIEHPQTLQQLLKESRTPEQQRALENALNSILNPQKATDQSQPTAAQGPKN